MSASRIITWTLWYLVFFCRPILLNLYEYLKKSLFLFLAEESLKDDSWRPMSQKAWKVNSKLLLLVGREACQLMSCSLFLFLEHGDQVL